MGSGRVGRCRPVPDPPPPWALDRRRPPGVASDRVSAVQTRDYPTIARRPLFQAGKRGASSHRLGVAYLRTRYLRWATPGASSTRSCSSRRSATIVDADARRLPRRTGTTWKLESSTSPAAGTDAGRSHRPRSPRRGRPLPRAPCRGRTGSRRHEEEVVPPDHLKRRTPVVVDHEHRLWKAVVAHHQFQAGSSPTFQARPDMYLPSTWAPILPSRLFDQSVWRSPRTPSWPMPDARPRGRTSMMEFHAPEIPERVRHLAPARVQPCSRRR